MIEVTRRATPVGAIRQVVHPVASSRKKELLTVLLKRPEMGQTLVFTRTKARANQLVRALEHSGRRVLAIHGNKSQNARTTALTSFRTGVIDTLIATDIAARGIDVDGITHVVNFDLPHVPEDYVHRIGRTARAGPSGNAISLASSEERPQLAAIERLVGKSIPREDLGFNTPDPAAANRVHSSQTFRSSRNRGGSGRPLGTSTAGNRGRGYAGQRRTPSL
jgi:ATP-dependent RNA helicase RhlE